MSNTQTGQSTQSQSKHLPYSKCSGYGHDHHRDRACQCLVWGKTCRKCNRQNHYKTVCRMIPPRRRQGNHSALNELRNTSSLTSNPATPASHSFSNMVPKQIVDNC